MRCQLFFSLTGGGFIINRSPKIHWAGHESAHVLLEATPSDLSRALGRSSRLVPVFFLSTSFGQGERKPWVIASAFFDCISEGRRYSRTGMDVAERSVFLPRYSLWFIVEARIGLGVTAMWLLFSAAWPFNSGASEAGGKISGDSYFLTFLFSHYNLLFAFGVLICIIFTGRFRVWAHTVLVLGVAVFMGTWCALFFSIAPRGIFSDWSYGIGAALTILGLAVLERQGDVHVPVTLIFLGEASYSIYLVHWLAISGMCKVVTSIGGRVLVPSPLSFFATACVALSLGIAFHLVVERPLTKAMSRVFVPSRKVFPSETAEA